MELWDLYNGHRQLTGHDHVEEIKDHASDIESRLEDSYCTNDSMKAENWKYIEGFQQAGENIVLINTDYEKAIRAVLEKKDDQ